MAPPLSGAEHRRVKQETRTVRNAAARNRREDFDRAYEWIEAMGATVTGGVSPAGFMYEVRVPGFHPAYALYLPDAVDALDHNVASFCDKVLPRNPQAKGPTGARLAPLCERRRAFLQRARGAPREAP